MKLNYIWHFFFFFFFKGTDVHRRSNTCIMSEVCILMKILFKNRKDCDVLRPLYLDCRQHLLLYLNRNTSSLPSPPNLSALQTILGLEVQTQFFLYSLSITTTTSITDQVIHSSAHVQLNQSWIKFSDFQKSAFVQHGRLKSEFCVWLYWLFWFISFWGCSSVSAGQKYIAKGYSILFAIAPSLKTVFNSCASFKYKNMKTDIYFLS